MLGLLANEPKSWRVLNEAVTVILFPHSYVLATILGSCSPSHQHTLWNELLESIIEDIRAMNKGATGIPLLDIHRCISYNFMQIKREL